MGSVSMRVVRSSKKAWKCSECGAEIPPMTKHIAMTGGTRICDNCTGGRRDPLGDFMHALAGAYKDRKERADERSR